MMNKATRQFSHAQVVEFRNLVRHGVYDSSHLARKVGVPPPIMRRVITGKTYADVPGALTTAPESKPHASRILTPEVVLFMRLNFLAGISATKIARAHRVSRHCAGDAIAGRTYVEVPEPVVMQAGAPRVLSNQQALEIRRRRTKGEKLVPLAEEFGVTPRTISDIARGRLYKDVEYPVLVD